LSAASTYVLEYADSGGGFEMIVAPVSFLV